MADAIDDLDKTNMMLMDLQEWMELDEDIPVTLRQLREAVFRGELVPTKLSNKNYFSKRDGLNWLESQRGKYRGKSQQRKNANGERARAAESGAAPP